jgi:hypothetical protein
LWGGVKRAQKRMCAVPCMWCSPSVVFLPPPPPPFAFLLRPLLVRADHLRCLFLLCGLLAIGFFAKRDLKRCIPDFSLSTFAAEAAEVYSAYHTAFYSGELNDLKNCVTETIFSVGLLGVFRSRVHMMLVFCLLLMHACGVYVHMCVCVFFLSLCLSVCMSVSCSVSVCVCDTCSSPSRKRKARRKRSSKKDPIESLRLRVSSNGSESMLSLSP